MLSDLYSQNTLVKAKKLVENEEVEQDPEKSGVYLVRGTSRHYRVQVTTSEESGEEPVYIVTCDCPNGMARGGMPSCYHSAAALMVEGVT